MKKIKKDTYPCIKRYCSAGGICTVVLFTGYGRGVYLSISSPYTNTIGSSTIYLIDRLYTSLNQRMVIKETITKVRRRYQR